ncbi:hypothetical protein J4Q44_G00247170 [Coregonus suidteri]|uniref:Uncharacterized protein n=1 Tax=Coregonus suidteri TaxID=861788 RepID=A0AAN8QM61_9TELE
MERLWSYLRKCGKITKEMTPSHRVDTLTDALNYAARVREKQAPAIQLCRQKVLKEETEAKESPVAQLVEHGTCNAKVVGSFPTGGQYENVCTH